jgi:nitrous oxidase accessory protein
MLSLLVAALLVAPGPAREIIVRPEGPITTVAAAVAVARRGDTITIHRGTYRTGNVEVRVPGLTIRGDGYPVLDGGGRDEILILAADGITITRLAFQGAGVSMTRDQAAIRVAGVKDCRILENRIDDSFFGIYLERATGCRVAGNVIRGNGAAEARNGNGIHLWNSTDATIDSNLVSRHRDGIYLEFARGVTALHNTSSDNRRYGMHFMFSDDCGYAENLFTTNGAGVAVMYSKRVTLQRNRFLDARGASAYGLLLKEIRESRISENEFARNTVGLYTEGASRNAFDGNTFADNGWGARLLASSEENQFVGNTFRGNSFDVTTNGLTNSNRFRRNQWERYAGYDLDRDGVGDVPHRPMRRFALLVERHEGAILLLRSPFADLLDLAESMLPVLTPETLVDEQPILWRAR